MDLVAFYERLRREYAQKVRYMLPKNVADSIFDSRVATQKLVDSFYYSAVVMNTAASTKDLFKSSQAPAIGTTNLNNGKPPLGEYMLVGAVQLVYGTNATLGATAWGELSDVLLNGEILLNQENRPIFPELTPMEIFRTSQKVTPLGFVVLAEPFLLWEDKQIKCEITATAATASNANVKMILHGVKNAKI